MLLFLGIKPASLYFSKFVRFKKEYYKRIRRNTQIFTPLKSVKKCRRNPRILVSKKSAK